MAEQGVLRRWKRFFPAFASIHAAIKAAEPGISRREFRDATDKVVAMLCNATDDEAVAEELRVVLDGMMVEALLTLELVPAMPKMLASTDLAQDVGALRNHPSERVRSLAIGIVRGWRASVKDELLKAAAAMEKLSQAMEPDEADDHHAKILQPSPPKKTANTSRSQPPFPKKQSARPVVGGSRVTTTAKIDPPPEKAPAAAAARSSHHRESVVPCCTDEKAMNAAKRKLREGYQEAEEAKRRRTIQVIQAPDRQRKMQAITRPRSRPSFAAAASTAKKSSGFSSLRRF
uniref:TFIIS N-terminal domain-containing protein n=1 Tax=Oryza glumipatula TaxID=40148 RepID=A0A0E0ADQ7_9ORYZ